MAKMIKEEDCPKGLPGWLATFGDLMSLLLTFFVLLLSFSTTTVTQLNSAMGALQGALGMLSGEPELSLPIRQSLPRTEGNLSQAEVIAKAASEMEEAVEEAGLQGDVMLEESSTGIVIRVDNKLFFGTGESDLKPSALSVLDKLAKILKPLPNQVNVQGHSDNQSINTEQYASNWELSGMRALQVARHFIQKGNISPDRIWITGYSQYRPLVPNTTEENRRKNRRVEIHILYKDNSDVPPGKVYNSLEEKGIQVQGRGQD
ncbi:MAG: OmpA family protein [bacterium]|nr:OmpA family protein [bacterium]